MSVEHVLHGLDGTNPLAFLAALGALRASGPEARLHWRDEGRWRPVLTLPEDSPGPADLVMADLERWRAGATMPLALDLEYAKAEKGSEGKRVRDLKPPPKPPIFRDFLERAAKAWPDDPDAADFAVAYATEAGRDGKDNTKPTAFHFTAGQQAFLDMVIALRDGLTRSHVDEALDGPWRYESTLPVLRWDVTGERLYALLASDPASDKARGVPGADWLAFLGLSFFPAVARGTHTFTTGFEDRSKEPWFCWPVWTAPLTRDVVRSLLALDLRDSTADERRARGVALLLRSRARRSDRGYGNFSAASAVP